MDKCRQLATVGWMFGVMVGCAVAQTPIRRAAPTGDFHASFQNKEWSRATDAAKALVDLGSEEEPSASYYLACALARDGRKEPALKALDACVDRGWFQSAALEQDPDLEAIRSDPRFAGIVEKVRLVERTRLEKFKSLVDRTVVEKHYPKNYNGSVRHPLILALHGYGGSGADIAQSWRAAADEVGAILVAPTAPHPTPIDGRGWGSTEEGEAIVLNIIDTMKKTGAVDESKIILTGFSQGGALAVAVGFRHPEIFAGVIPICGVFDPATVRIPLKTMPAFPRIAILNGEDDREVENNREAARLLHRINAPVRLRLYHGVAHSLPPTRDVELRSAARFVLNLPDDGG